MALVTEKWAREDRTVTITDDLHVLWHMYIGQDTPEGYVLSDERKRTLRAARRAARRLRAIDPGKWARTV